MDRLTTFAPGAAVQFHPAVPGILGLLGNAHLGDTLCTSPLPRLFFERYGTRLRVKDHPIMRAVFTGNPFVLGFATEATISFDNRMQGSGHVLQRLEQGFGLPVDPVPRPEIYLDEAERQWADAERGGWAAPRPVCLLSTAAVTDKGNLEGVDWKTIVELLSGEFTVVQPVLSEAPVQGAIVYRGLSTRQYMALMSVADRFVGGTSGGSHVAAAFGVPSLVVAWRHMLDHLRFPVSGLGMPASFLYPQHWFIAAEDLAPGRFREARLRELLANMSQRGRAGRATDVGNHARSPCGFTAAALARAVWSGNRLVRVPAAAKAQALHSNSGTSRCSPVRVVNSRS